MLRIAFYVILSLQGESQLLLLGPFLRQHCIFHVRFQNKSLLHFILKLREINGSLSFQGRHHTFPEIGIEVILVTFL